MGGVELQISVQLSPKLNKLIFPFPYPIKHFECQVFYQNYTDSGMIALLYFLQKSLLIWDHSRFACQLIHVLLQVSSSQLHQSSPGQPLPL